MIKNALLAAPILAAVLLAACKKAPPAEPAAEAPAPSPAIPAQRMPAQKPESPINSQALGDSDDAVQQALADLSTKPQYAGWLKQENLVRRAAAAVDLVAVGESPMDSLGFLAPKKKVQVVKRDDKLYLDPKGFSRFDALADTFASLDPKKAGVAYKRLEPLMQSACAELGNPRCEFRPVLHRALHELMTAPAVEGDVPLREKVLSYAIDDDDLESLSNAQKLLIRMGPRNAAKVQRQLRRLAPELGMAADTLPAQRVHKTNP